MPVYSSGEAPWIAIMDKITTVVIEEGVTSVGRTSFYGATNLTTVILPSTIKSIDAYAFYGCSALKSITIPATVTEIGTYAFRKSGIKTVEFETNYGWSAGDSAVTTAEINADGASLLKSLYKVKWTRDVNAQPETDVNYVDGGTCGLGVKWVLTLLENGKMKLTITGKGAMTEFSTAAAPWFAYAESIVEVEIGEGVTTIGRCAFYYLKKLEKVTMASTVTTIGDYAFNICWKLKEIDLTNVTKIGKDAFKKTGVKL